MECFNFTKDALYLISDAYGYSLFKGVSSDFNGVLTVQLLDTSIDIYKEDVGKLMIVGIDYLRLVVSEKQLNVF